MNKSQHTKPLFTEYENVLTSKRVKYAFNVGWFSSIFGSNRSNAFNNTPKVTSGYLIWSKQILNKGNFK